MSNTSSENRGSGQKRRRSRGGRNRNRNRNQQGNRPQGENRQGGNRQGGNRQGNSGDRRRRRSEPKPKPLTWWQKLLKAIGLYKEPARPQRGGSKTPKSNTRNARSDAGAKPEKERKPREGREPREKREPREPVSTEDVTTKRVYLGNLSYEATESDLEELFRGVGTVRRVEIVYNRRTHRSKGYGFVDMLGVDEAKRAVEVLHDQFFMGRKLVVSGAKSQGPADDDQDDGDDDAAGETPAATDEAQGTPPAAS